MALASTNGSSIDPLCELEEEFHTTRRQILAAATRSAGWDATAALAGPGSSAEFVERIRDLAERVHEACGPRSSSGAVAAPA